MRFFILNTDYPLFIRWLYNQYPGLTEEEYLVQYQKRMLSYFGTNDFFSSNLYKLGYEGWDVIANIEPMQKAWAIENGFKISDSKLSLRWRKKFIPWPYYIKHWKYWLYPILLAQIKYYRPDVIFSLAMEIIDDDFLRQVRPFTRLIVGQHAATPLYSKISEYDLVFSSLPNQVAYFRKEGLNSELLPLSFEHTLINRIDLTANKIHDVVFIGGVSDMYRDSIPILEKISEMGNLKIWSFDRTAIMNNPLLRNSYRGELWGLEMLQTLQNAKIVLNRHSNFADKFFANNIRLFEATGVGSLLLTDDKPNLSDFFSVGHDIISYKSQTDCIEKIEFMLKNDQFRISISKNGQQKTLKDHSYLNRMVMLVDILKKYI